ncbi:TPA: rhamnan synthesis F family protein, partial [Streptococcus pyogenes]
MNRILLYVHFNKYNKISAHVYYQLEQMRSLFSKIVFISNSKVSHEDLKRLKNHCLVDEFLQRKNKGFDFSAWHDGLITMGFDKLEEFDSLTIMNDTCFGPIWEMGPYFENFEEKEAVDFWGITNNRGTKAFKEHVQSYFMTFKNQVIQNKVFQ